VVTSSSFSWHRSNKATDAVLVAGKVLAALKRPFCIGPHRIDISVSIGIAVYPQHGEDVNQLLKNADTAMYLRQEGGPQLLPILPARSPKRPGPSLLAEWLGDG
jgi:GGDEF domain-containing protein